MRVPANIRGLHRILRPISPVKRPRRSLSRAIYQNQNPPGEEEHLVRYGNLRLDLFSFSAFRGETKIVLSTLGAGLLHFFMRNPGKALSRQEILRRVWLSPPKILASNVLSVLINQLRFKLEVGPEPSRLIHTVRGGGYVFESRSSHT